MKRDYISKIHITSSGYANTWKCLKYEYNIIARQFNSIYCLIAVVLKK